VGRKLVKKLENKGYKKSWKFFLRKFKKKFFSKKQRELQKIIGNKFGEDVWNFLRGVDHTALKIFQVFLLS
jgi:hypothetical protein